MLDYVLHALVAGIDFLHRAGAALRDQYLDRIEDFLWSNLMRLHDEPGDGGEVNGRAFSSEAFCRTPAGS